jgi:hypothetical protein
VHQVAFGVLSELFSGHNPPVEIRTNVSQAQGRRNTKPPGRQRYLLINLDEIGAVTLSARADKCYNHARPEGCHLS